MQILLVLLLGVAQSDVTELFSRPEPGLIQNEVAPLQEAPSVPYDEPQLQVGPLFPNEQNVFMPPDGADISPLQNFAPPHGARFDSPLGHSHHPGWQGVPLGTGAQRACPGCKPGPQAHFDFEPGVDAFAHGSDSSCPPCQTCPPVGGCPGCRWGYCSLFGGWHLCNCCDPCTRKRLQAKYCGTPGDMYPETPYFPVNHGSYYFRPYTYSHIAQQQAVATRWGADPRAPYQSILFSQLYQEMGIPLISADRDYTGMKIPPRDRKPSDYFTTVP